MNEEIKKHLDAIAEHLKGTKHSFLFLMVDGDKQHVVKNCSAHDSAALMVNCLEATPDIEASFTAIVMNLQATENEEKTFQERLSEKLDEKEMSKITE